MKIGHYDPASGEHLSQLLRSTSTPSRLFDQEFPVREPPIASRRPQVLLGRSVKSSFGKRK